jgi:hypothetical protein
VLTGSAHGGVTVLLPGHVSESKDIVVHGNAAEGINKSIGSSLSLLIYLKQTTGAKAATGI